MIALSSKFTRVVRSCAGGVKTLADKFEVEKTSRCPHCPALCPAAAQASSLTLTSEPCSCNHRTMFNMMAQSWKDSFTQKAAMLLRRQALGRPCQVGKKARLPQAVRSIPSDYLAVHKHICMLHDVAARLDCDPSHF